MGFADSTGIMAPMRKYAVFLLAFTLLGLLLTWPMAPMFATHVPGDGIDDPSLAWNLWWVKHALVDAPQNAFACDWQFWPIGINLAFYTVTLLNGMLGIPLQAVFGLIPTYNLLLLSSFALSGMGGFLVARAFLGPRVRGRQASVAAFAGGALYAFASAKLFYAALGQGNIASSQWIPFAALYLWRAARPGGRARDAMLAALFLVLQAYAELTYASFLLVFAGLAFVWGLLPRGSSARRGVVARYGIVALLFLAGLAPILANMLPDLRAEGDFFTSGGGFSDVFSADLAGYLVPTQLHPLLGGIVRHWSEASSQAGRHFAVDKGQHVYLGYVAALLALAGAWRGRRQRATALWAGAAGMFFLLTLGPNLRIAGGDTGIPLPFRIMEQLPFFKGNRYPSRYSVMLLLSLSPLAASGALALVERMRTRAWAPLFALLVGLMLFEHLSAPLPVFDLRVPRLYDSIAPAGGRDARTVLELPLGWRNGARVAGKQDLLIMQQLWYQTQHKQRLLGGNTSRNPEFKFQYFAELPTLARLIAEINAADLPQHDALRGRLAATPVTGEERLLAREWAAFTGIEHVMVHRDKLTSETEALARDLFALSLVGEDGPLALYRVPASSPPASYRLASDAGRLALAEGWSPPAPGSDGRAPDGSDLPVYAQRREAGLLLPLPAGPATLQLRAGSLVANQQMAVRVNGELVGTVALPLAPGWIELAVPARPSRPPLSRVQLEFAATVRVDEFGARLGRSGPAALLVRSAGQETGDFGHIYLNGREVSPNRRGYNLVALDASGALVHAAAFDTHGDPDAGARMAQWLAGLARGLTVAGAVRDEASMNLGADAVEALAALGLRGDLRGHFRWGHAFIAVTGQPEQAAEQTSAIRPAQLSVGLPASEPHLAAQMYEVRIIDK